MYEDFWQFLVMKFRLHLIDVHFTRHSSIHSNARNMSGNLFYETFVVVFKYVENS